MAKQRLANEDELDTIDGDDADNGEYNAKRPLSSKQKLGFAAIVLFVLLGFIWFGGGSSEPPPAPPVVTAQPDSTGFRPAPLIIPPPPPAPPAQPVLPLPREVAAPATSEAAASAIFAFNQGGGDGSSNRAGSITPAETQVLAGSGIEQTSLSARLRPTRIEGTKAQILPHPDLTITKGTILPCTLQTAIDTTLAGFVKCVIPQDIMGTTGRVTLLDRGTTIIGEIQSGLEQGQERVFVLWDRAETPSHVIISMASPGVDGLGRAGLSGKVNTHFWKRFSNALLFTVVEGAFDVGKAYAAGRTESGDGGGGDGGSGGGGGGTSVSVPDTSRLSEIALQSSIDIPPTLQKNQGERVAIFVAQDLDFSEVYSLRYVQHGGAYK